jgi:hypothetical protein
LLNAKVTFTSISPVNDKTTISNIIAIVANVPEENVEITKFTISKALVRTRALLGSVYSIDVEFTITVSSRTQATALESAMNTVAFQTALLETTQSVFNDVSDAKVTSITIPGLLTMSPSPTLASKPVDKEDLPETWRNVIYIVFTFIMVQSILGMLFCCCMRRRRREEDEKAKKQDDDIKKVNRRRY